MPSPSPTLTLGAAIERALASHPRLRAAAFELEAAEGAVQQAALPPNPRSGSSRRTRVAKRVRSPCC
ncbi:hypothetical protein ACQ86G_20835 [Roseateles chitinivorans]|uniref:hypothetical protein n=1 Tax=Roseateles chitinivorans TaxID=2917965 RepID=UPI003D674058